jgi:hypothetical protein
VQFVYEIYFKLSPLLGNPDIQHYVRFEHVIAFAVVAVLLSLAYPSRPWFVSGAVLLSILVLEYLQTLTPDRHGSLTDAGEKILGGILGVVFFNSWRWWRNSRQA